jgi:hypothetical protein
MQQWSGKLRNVIPEAEVIGALREEPGFLVRIRRDRAIDAMYLESIAQRLRQIGATGWSWEVCDADVIKIRVYTRSHERLLCKLALLSIVLAIYYDIHGITEAIGSWRGP